MTSQEGAFVLWAYILVFLVAAIALAATFMVGFSPENKSRNPRYEQRTRKNITMLTTMYVLTTVAGAALIIYLVNM